MTPDQPLGASLAQLRAALGLDRPEFLTLVESLGGPGVSVNRLAKVEEGDGTLLPREWAALLESLAVAVGPSTGLDELRAAVASHVPLIEQPPASSPVRRRAQWSRLLSRADSARINPLIRAFIRRHDVDPRAEAAEVARRLALGDHAWRADPSDLAQVVAVPARYVAAPKSRHLARVTLRNAGTVPWRDRLLHRLGPFVTSSLPFTPGLLVVPDTEPGRTCTIVIPLEAQHFVNLAIVRYTMVFPDCSLAMPGSLRLEVDTRHADRPDRTFAIPAGLVRTARRVLHR